ncbi:MAG: hypothetical protein AMS18_00020 [Gemmatimonas sp. SG8_17]|nr:MAG: hypothetical protein AMS18_00020 [Gemmatimonas sp. SG8_17]
MDETVGAGGEPGEGLDTEFTDLTDLDYLRYSESALAWVNVTIDDIATHHGVANNTIPKFSTGNGFVDSLITDNGVTVSVNAGLYVEGTLNLNTADMYIDTGYSIRDESNLYHAFMPRAAADQLLVRSPGNVVIQIDADNNATTNFFEIRHDASTYSGGTSLFKISEDETVVIGTLHINPADTPALADGGVKESLLRWRGYYDSDPTGSIITSTRDITARIEMDYAAAAGEYRLAFINDSSEEFFTLEGDTKRVGINTSTPDVELDILGDMQLVDTGASSSTSGPIISLYEDDGAAIGIDHRMGALCFGAAYDASGNRSCGAMVAAAADEAWSSTVRATRLEFWVTEEEPTYTTPYLAWYIDESGNLLSATDETPAGWTSGRITMKNNRAIFARNFNDTGSYPLIYLSSSNHIILGAPPTSCDIQLILNNTTPGKVYIPYGNFQVLASGTYSLTGPYTVRIADKSTNNGLVVEKDTGYIEIVAAINADTTGEWCGIGGMVHSTGAGMPYFYLWAPGGNYGTPAATQASKVLGEIQAGGWAATVGYAAIGAKIQFINPIASVWANGDTPGAIVFYATEDGSGTPTEVLRLGDGAKIGMYGVTPVSRASALTSADASTVDTTYGSEEAAVIANNRTRIGEIETALQNIGIIN